MCLCQWHIDGTTCEVDYEECGPGACYNGTCQDEMNAYTCVCPNDTCNTLCQDTGDTCRMMTTNTCKYMVDLCMITYKLLSLADKKYTKLYMFLTTTIVLSI